MFKCQDLRTKSLTLECQLNDTEPIVSWNIYITKTRNKLGYITLYADGGIVPNMSTYLVEAYTAVSNYAKNYNIQPYLQVF
jgi:hypothetical protein